MSAKPEVASEVPPHVQMLDHIVGYWTSCAILVAAKLKIADLLRDGPQNADRLASAAGAKAPFLYRVLRMLASSGIFHETPDGRFENTPLSETLRSDAPNSMRAFAVMIADPYILEAWGQLLHTVKTGETAFDHIHHKRVFEFLNEHPDLAHEFGESMTSISNAENPAIAAAYDFTGIRKLVDVGGGHGSLMASILDHAPDLHGVIHDRPQVIEQAGADVHAKAKAMAARGEFVPGDFFSSVPPADAYIMKYILHDWEDELCVKILQNCRHALTGNGKVLVVDSVIPPGNDRHWGKLLDINMMALTGGRERTRAEFEPLFAKAGWRVTRVVPTACPLSIVEGTPA